jgi:catechol 2,3-dioxygenase-like lactoylglutathione lyase family enzyme
VKIKAVVETAIYADDLQAAETFYGTVLALRVMGREPGRHVFFPAGERAYGASWDTVFWQGGKTAVNRSAERYEIAMGESAGASHS